MQLGHNMARLRPGDLDDLTVASSKLVEAAAAIGAWKSPAAALTVALLRDANDIVMRIRDRGLARMQFVIGKMCDQLDQQARAKAAADQKREDER